MSNPSKLKRLCDKYKLTLSVAESASGGRLAALITSVSGASTFFEGGVVAYSLAQKVKLLGVEPNHAKAVNCVSPFVAKEMALGVRNLFGTSLAISITGYAEPNPDVEVPFCHIGFAVGGSLISEVLEYDIIPSGVEASKWSPDREEVQGYFAEMALEGLIHWLQPSEGPC